MSPKWLDWAKRIQAISQTGLAYTKDPYDAERFEELRALSLEIMEEYTGVGKERLRDIFAAETGYATPKVDVRGVAFRDGKILLVREKEDRGWSLPGGWADIGLSPKEIAAKEMKEESGFDAIPLRLLAVLDKSKHDHPPSAYHIYKIFILCEIVGGAAAEGLETSGVGFFGRDELPDLSVERNTESQIQAMFDLSSDPGRGALLD